MDLLEQNKDDAANPAGKTPEGPPCQEDSAELNAIIDHLPMALYWKDAGLTYRGGNAEFLRMTGLTRRELYGKTDADLHAEKIARRFRQEDGEFLSGERKEGWFSDKYIPMKDGADIWARTYKIPVFDGEARIKYIMGLVQDVTEIKQDEIALEERESILRTILNATSERIVFVDQPGKILVANAAFMRDFAPQRQEAAGLLIDDLLASPFFQKILGGMYNALASGKPRHFDLTPEESRTDKYFDVSIYPVNSGKEIIGAAIFANDITQRKQDEQALLQRSEELRAAMLEAEKASKSKGDFLSRMSHEIRTPIGAIIGMTKIAFASDDPQKVRDCLNKIDSSSRHLLGIINDVLDMSKIEAGKLVLSDAVFSLDDLITDIKNVSSVRSEEKRQDFRIVVDNTLPECFFADELRLRQVVTNLLSNAVKFTPEEGTVRLELKNLGLKDGAVLLEVTVSDSGIGISPEQQAALFQPFEQADGGIARKYGGTGLGLVICKKIVEMMGGRIRVESELGAGSRFIFNVRLKVHDKGEKAGGPALQIGDMRALIVDDNFETREYLKHILEKIGVRCDAAANGNQALRLAAEAKESKDVFNVFFVERALPGGINGVELTARIKKLLCGKAAVIMTSVSEWEEFREEAVQAGACGFIPKPLFPSAVFDVLQEISGAAAGAGVREGEKSVPDLTGCKILIAEDVEINREIAQALLAVTGAQLDFAENGRQAVDKFRAGRGEYDLILMDIHMPEMDGYEATKLIRAGDGEEARLIPIMAMTADAFKEDIEKCKEVGMNDHITKPIDENELYKKIVSCRAAGRLGSQARNGAKDEQKE
ncbi:MAG: response regulator [Clostridiales bacterium]|nr:response regulator [Clostridiales bacterium]